MTTYLTAVPAYGRDYNSKAEVRAAWNNGKDFKIESMNASGYVNREDLPPGVQLNIRYARLTKVCVIPAVSPPQEPPG